MPAPGSSRGNRPSVLLSTFMLMKHEGAKRLEDVRHLHREPGLMKLPGFEQVPKARTPGNWLRRIGSSEQSMQALVEFQIKLKRLIQIKSERNNSMNHIVSTKLSDSKSRQRGWRRCAAAPKDCRLTHTV